LIQWAEDCYKQQTDPGVFNTPDHNAVFDDNGNELLIDAITLTGEKWLGEQSRRRPGMQRKNWYCVEATPAVLYTTAAGLSNLFISSRQFSVEIKLTDSTAIDVWQPVSRNKSKQNFHSLE